MVEHDPTASATLIPTLEGMQRTCESMRPGILLSVAVTVGGRGIAVLRIC